ncbi:MAG: hypothetical protein VZR56_05420 [Treponema sp.]|nr:hypothetical protein [Treponema sp.]MBR6296046.1 hypothetical protein [Treponema sp.]MEE3313576.1 hypothetical protein [Treponema sp.]
MKLTHQKIRILIPFLIVIFSLSSCNRNREIKIETEDPLALTPGIEWAVIKEPYAALREEASYESNVVSHARRGEILLITGKTYLSTGSGKNKRIVTWYCFDEGWLDESCMDIYDNKMKAEKEASKMESEK